MQPKQIDLLVHCRWLIPIIPESQILENYSIAINAGKIVDLLPMSQAQQGFTANREVQLNRHLIMPGLINAHSHSAMRLLRGHNDDLALQNWLENYVWCPESRFTDANFIRDGANLAMAEMIKTGTTCFAEMYCFHDMFIEAVRSAGMRSQLGFIVRETQTPFGKNADDYIHRGLALYDDTANHPLIGVACTPDNPNNLSDTVMQRLATFANELDLPIHLYCHEGAADIEVSLSKWGCRPLQRLFDKGLLLPQTQLVHMNQVSHEDIALLKKTNSHVIKLSDESCPVAQLSEADISLSLGTGGATGNHHLDLFATIKATAIALKSDALNPALAAHKALRCATINGAKALGLSREIGSIEVGKYADMVAIEIDSIAHQPLYNPVAQLVYGQSGNQVTHSWVAGQSLLTDGKLVNFNEQNLVQSARDWCIKIAQ